MQYDSVPEHIRVGDLPDASEPRDISILLRLWYPIEPSVPDPLQIEIAASEALERLTLSSP